MALEGTRVSVIGGTAAAEVVLHREVKARIAAMQADGSAEGLDLQGLRRAARAAVAAEFDAVHSVERAFRTDSVDEIIEPSALRPAVAAYLLAGTLAAVRPEARFAALRRRGRPRADRPAASA